MKIVKDGGENIITLYIYFYIHAFLWPIDTPGISLSYQCAHLSATINIYSMYSRNKELHNVCHKKRIFRFQSQHFSVLKVRAAFCLASTKACNIKSYSGHLAPSSTTQYIPAIIVGYDPVVYLTTRVYQCLVLHRTDIWLSDSFPNLLHCTWFARVERLMQCDNSFPALYFVFDSGLEYQHRLIFVRCKLIHRNYMSPTQGGSENLLFARSILYVP